MKSSIFLRIFIAVSAVILVMLIILFSVTYSIIYQHSVDGQKSEMIKVCTTIAGNYADTYNDPDANPAVLRSTMYTMSSTLNARLFITNTVGAAVMCTDAYPCVHVYGNIDSEILASALESGLYSEFDRLDGLYSAKFFTYGIPVMKDNECIGYVFASKNTSAIDSLTSSVLNTFLIIFVVMLLFAYIVIYLITYRLTKPIRNLTSAARDLAEGDFSARVEVSGKDEISQLSLTFNNMADSLESLERMRSSFVANVSHELKTPMTSMSGFIDGILDGTIPPEQHNHYLEIVSNETKRLARLVKTLLYLSKIEAGEETANFSQFNYASVITEVIISLEPRLSEKNMNIEGLEWDSVINTSADRDMIYQVTYNLVENAIKYSPDGGVIKFSFDTRQGKHYISITNTGVGISKEDQKHIFERFYKVDKSRGLDSKSTGLGLYLVVTLLKINEQSIFVDSDGESYTTFTFTLNDG